MGDSGPLTLAIDVGGSGLKATVLAPDGEMLSERVRRDTPYPCTPPVLLDELDALAKTQPHYDRVSVGYPGAIRRGIVRDVTAFVRPAPGEPKDPKLIKEWIGFDLQSALAQRFGKPVRVANDADVQGCAVIEGTRHGAGHHARHRRRLRGVLRRHPAAAHGAVARPVRRGPVDRGGVRRERAAQRRQARRGASAC